jgi:hypothetical protein
MPLRFSTLYRKTPSPVEISLILGVEEARELVEGFLISHPEPSRGISYDSTEIFRQAQDDNICIALSIAPLDKKRKICYCIRSFKNE